MVRIAIIVFTALFATGTVACERPISPVFTDEIQRIDPAKTLLLIQRIKNATGGGLVVS